MPGGRLGRATHAAAGLEAAPGAQAAGGQPQPLVDGSCPRRASGWSTALREISKNSAIASRPPPEVDWYEELITESMPTARSNGAIAITATAVVQLGPAMPLSCGRAECYHDPY
jgi:hypothetical protein